MGTEGRGRTCQHATNTTHHTNINTPHDTTRYQVRVCWLAEPAALALLTTTLTLALTLTLILTLTLTLSPGAVMLAGRAPGPRPPRHLGRRLQPIPASGRGDKERVHTVSGWGMSWWVDR